MVCIVGHCVTCTMEEAAVSLPTDHSSSLRSHRSLSAARALQSAPTSSCRTETETVIVMMCIYMPAIDRSLTPTTNINNKTVGEKPQRSARERGQQHIRNRPRKTLDPKKVKEWEWRWCVYLRGMIHATAFTLRVASFNVAMHPFAVFSRRQARSTPVHRPTRRCRRAG